MTDDSYEPISVCTVDNEGFLLVKGIEDWITKLVPVVTNYPPSAPVSPGDYPTCVLMMDKDTGAKFLVARYEEQKNDKKENI